MDSCDHHCSLHRTYRSSSLPWDRLTTTGRQGSPSFDLHRHVLNPELSRVPANLTCSLSSSSVIKVQQSIAPDSPDHRLDFTCLHHSHL
ncbi:hypothetical protein Bpfe_018050 [Biomphalaria pfeifferi]|uniref:Uncharacterized protein n=1 Tax=Biomphalaria pfeifferi TaxID=112525 RepID=A0AAD8BDH8_BIOPF|nr:hypothetical protein Bpfe_018050 [Biomphalaria pfeifferi]